MKMKIAGLFVLLSGTAHGVLMKQDVPPPPVEDMPPPAMEEPLPPAGHGSWLKAQLDPKYDVDQHPLKGHYDKIEQETVDARRKNVEPVK